MKPFDMKLVLAGKPVTTREGAPVTQLMKFETAAENVYRIAGVCNGELQVWQDDGTYEYKGESRMDLFMKTIRREGWINIFPNGVTSYIYPNEQEANNGDIFMARNQRIACVKVEWEE